MGSSFLLKALTIFGAGGTPIIFFGLTSTNTEGQRQFRGSLNLDQDSKLEAERKGGYGLEGLTKEKGQGVSKEEGEKFAGTSARSVYKLAFRSSWAQEADKNTGKKSAKGALGLIKASGGGGSDKELKVEEIKVGDDKKVWLIIAKSETSIYLIPVVRSSGEKQEQRGSSGSRESIEDDLGEKGVEDIAKWTQEFDRSEGWEKERNNNLQRNYKSGIQIKRGGSIMTKQDQKITEWKREGKKIVYYEGDQKQEKAGNKEESGGNEVKLGRNAGGIFGKTIPRNCRECKQNEKYFPLDIAVLGDSKKIENKSNSSTRSLIQEIEINDKITQVVGVRLDQVVINEAGIGDGKENQISGGNVSKPSLIRELLK